MTEWEGSEAYRLRGAEVALWLFAACLVLSLHAVAASLFHNRPSAMPAQDMSSAIAIELAPLPVTHESGDTVIAENVSALAQQNSLPDDPIDAASREEPPPDASLRQESVAETGLEHETAAAPSEDPTLATEEETPDLSARAEASVPLPPPRPRDLPRPERRQTNAMQAHAASPSRASPRPRAESPQAARTAAPETARDRNSHQATARWQARLLAHLERHKRYPHEARLRREDGVVHLGFRIDESGLVTAARIVRSSGHQSLDDEVLRMIHRASPVPAPPDGTSRNLTVPIRFSLR